MKTLAIVTNARAADQRSMIGYGELLLEAARLSGVKVVELRGSSFFGELLPERVKGKPRKLANNLDRFLATPLKFLGRRADIVHVVDPGNVVYLPFVRHRRSIATVHDMIPYLALDGRLPGWKPSPTGRWLMNRITARLAKVDHIVCVSHATKRDFLSYVNIPEHRVSVIHNAAFQPMKPASRGPCIDLRTRLGLPIEAPLILHVGRNFYKNREAVLDVTAAVRRTRPEVHLVMVGALTPGLMTQAEHLGLSEALHVLERVAQEDMATLYSTASVLLFPSLYEGFGLPVLEAQMCGTSVVCSDAGALPEVAGEMAAMAHCSDIGALTEKVLACLDQGKAEHSNADLISVKSTFNWTDWKKKHLDLYRKTLGFRS